MKNEKTILITDDDIDYLEQMKFHVENFGYKTLTANSQKECEQIIENEHFDLAILDLMMENDDSGFILSYKIKKKNPDLPVILATSVSSATRFVFEPENETEKSWIKADKYLEKGIRPDQLQREISKLLKL
ncbi:MAG: response regulator [Bacteroidales bacterium]|nr:response regulator [Bacteroidales bacterium]MBN2755771.1 response regulator [Bacteroidales bacterium]